MTPSPHSTPFGVSPISAKVADTPWDVQGPDGAPAAAPVDYPSLPLDLSASLGQFDATRQAENEPSPDAAPANRLLGDLIDPEPAWKRWLYLGIALAITCAFGFFLLSYWAPAPGRPGIDQNGYLVGGRKFAYTGTTGFKPSDDFQFVGAMWVRTTAEERVPSFSKPAFLRRWLTVHTKEGWYYPKYPFGMPLLYAAVLRIGGPEHGPEWAFLVSPVCTTLAALGMFLLTRAVAGSFYGLMGMILLGGGYVTLELAQDPGSHAASLCMVVWGMFFLVRWCQAGRWWSAIAAGLLLGFAVTVRYTEALLLFPFFPLDQVLKDTGLSKDHPHWWTVVQIARYLPIGPLGIAVIASMRWSRIRSYFNASLPLIAWAIPVGALVSFNWFAMGRITGYDLTNESEGFTTVEFLKKWDFTIEQLVLYAMFLVLPLGLIGMALIYRHSSRLGLILTLWFLPGVLLYNSYYWGHNIPGIAFTRFFLTFMPAVILAALWLIRSAETGAGIASTEMPVLRRRGSIGAPIGAGLLTAAVASVSLYTCVGNLERQHRGNINLAFSAGRIVAQIHPKPIRSNWAPAAAQPAGAGVLTPIIFVDEGIFPQLMQYIQFRCDADWYTLDSFSQRLSGGFGMMAIMQNNDGKPDGAVPLQLERIKHMKEFFKGKTASDLLKEQRRVMETAWENGRAVYAVVTPVQLAQFKRQVMTEDYEMTELDQWSEPCRIDFPSLLKESPNPVRAGFMWDGNPGMDTPPGRLTPPQMFMEAVFRWKPQTLSLQQIRRKAPAGGE